MRAQVDRIVDAWGRLDARDLERVERGTEAASAATTARVVGSLRELFAADAAEQHATPLEVVRTAYREPTAVLASVGIPAVERDEFDERAWPDDRYGMVPRTLGDLGDPELAPLLLAWGLAKAAVLRARRRDPGPGTDRRALATQFPPASRRAVHIAETFPRLPGNLGR